MLLDRLREVILVRSKKAIWLCEVLEEQERIVLNWRVLQKYSQDYDENVGNK